MNLVPPGTDIFHLTVARSQTVFLAIVTATLTFVNPRLENVSVITTQPERTVNSAPEDTTATLWPEPPRIVYRATVQTGAPVSSWKKTSSCVQSVPLDTPARSVTFALMVTSGIPEVFLELPGLVKYAPVTKT